MHENNSRPAGNSQAELEARLLVPSNDIQNPELSIVIPALNEEITIGLFVDWCKQGIAAAKVDAEILIIDSSNDHTAEIAVAHGARVLKTPKRGLGRAYIDAISVIRGRYVLMGDADCTYDFRDIQAFVEKFRSGSEFIMGSRFKGSIEYGAMPPLHRYFGTPLTTWILNVMYGTHFSDIHCGMRGITLDALKRINLVSQSWEYASEMVLKSVHLDLTASEVPVRFLNAPEGRVSHLVQGGWSASWKAGWINLKAMFVFGADFFLIVPGLLLLVLGLVPLMLLAAGPRAIGEITFSVNSMLLALVISILGLQFVFIGAIAQSLYDAVGRKRRRWLSIFSYTRTTLLCAAVFLVGLLLEARFVAAFAAENYQMSKSLIAVNHQAIFGVFLMMGSAIVFVSTLLIHAIGLYLPLKQSVASGTAHIVSAAETGEGASGSPRRDRPPQHIA
jgi:glycosyltransferase involved in cell wall biosynthesis